ncbi:MAG: DUF72 domain-containing protein [Candidatus Pacearchaeota archaeon]
MQNYVGTSGYVYWHWQGLFYPSNLPSSKWFDFYAKHFNTVEINMSFYRWPKESTIKSWFYRAKKIEKETGRPFVYTIKANRLITHIKKLANVKKILNDFYQLIDKVKPYLGCVLFQLPPSLKYDENRLKNFVNILNENYRNVIEFRHTSWWKEKTYKILEDNATFCIVSAPGLPEDFIKTTDIIYVRFHGKKLWYGSNYSDVELKEWAKKIKQAKAKEVYCYFNNDFNAYAVYNAIKLKKLLNK